MQFQITFFNSVKVVETLIVQMVKNGLIHQQQIHHQIRQTIMVERKVAYNFDRKHYLNCINVQLYQKNFNDF